MKKEKIEEKLRQKFNDDYTIKMFTNFVLEFQECFGEIMPSEEVINRIKSNIFGNIKIVEKFNNEELDGQYNDDGIIYLRKDKLANERYIKYLLFHEILHAITTIKDENGKDLMMGFSYLKNSYGKGLNEAITEYLTQIRNEKFENNREDLISDYRTVVEQMRRMIDIFGKEKVMHYYFYEPDKFKEFINSQKMNYDELQLAFTQLCSKDQAVYCIENGKRLINPNDYRVYRYSKTIFDNYSNAIGEVNSLESFEKKYKIFQTCANEKCDCINTMLLLYYRSMGQDVDRLLSLGIQFDEIKEVLNRLNIRIDVLKNMYNISKLFVQDKNQTAINLYELYMKNPSMYFNVFAQNYPYIFDHFKEMDSFANEEIYDMYKYYIIGALLKNHPQIDYSDISYYKIEEAKSRMLLYIFYASDSQKYAYLANGREIKPIKIDEDTNAFEIKINENCICQIIYNKDDKFNYRISATKGFDIKEYMKDVNFKTTHYYSEKSDIEYWLQEVAKDEKDKSRLQMTLNKIQSRMNDRKGRNHED